MALQWRYWSFTNSTAWPSAESDRAPELEAELWAALDRLAQEGVTPAELARAKKLLRSQAVRSLAHNFFRGLLVGLFHLKTGDAQLANRILSSLEAVTIDDILRVARTYLREDNRSVVVLKPVTPEESAALGAAMRAAHAWMNAHGAAIGWGELLRAVVKPGAGRTIRPAPGASRQSRAWTRGSRRSSCSGTGRG